MSSVAADESLISAHERLMNSFRRNDASGIASEYGDDLVFMPPNDQSLYGKNEVHEWYSEYFAHFVVKGFVETERHVMVLGEAAILRWSYQIIINPKAGGDRIVDEGRVMQIWNRDTAGQWRISQQIWNSTRPIGSGTSRFMSLLKQRMNVPTPDG